MTTDEEIKKIIEETLKERKKKTVAKIFHDPVKAEAIAYLFGMAFVLTLVVTIMFAVMPQSSFSSLKGDDDAKQFEKIVLDKSYCTQLKTYLHEINQKSGIGYDVIGADMQKEITARC